MTSIATLLAEKEPTVFVVHGEPAIGRVLKPLAKAMHWQIVAFASPQAFLATCDAAGPGCLLYHVPPESTNGFAWLEQLSSLGIHLPVIVLSACGEVPRVVEAMRAGARNYLKKPCGEGQLAEAVSEALAWDAANRQRLAERVRLHRRLARLTPGEREVLRLLVEGHSNRRVAAALGISVRAVEVRRAKLMRKMKAESLAELVRLALTALPDAPDEASFVRGGGVVDKPSGKSKMATIHPPAPGGV